MLGEHLEEQCPAPTLRPAPSIQGYVLIVLTLALDQFLEGPAHSRQSQIISLSLLSVPGGQGHYHSTLGSCGLAPAPSASPFCAHVGSICSHTSPSHCF